MDTTQLVDDNLFRSLLDCWNSHESLREDRAPIAELANSRHRLDDARFLVCAGRHR
jgi:hypothetical protein